MPRGTPGTGLTLVSVKVSSETASEADPEGSESGLRALDWAMCCSDVLFPMARLQVMSVEVETQDPLS